MMSEIHVRGLADLQKFLDQLPAKLETNVMRGALRAGANVIKNEAKQNAPVQDGDLKASIRVSARIDRQRGAVVASVKAGDKKAWYAHIIEFTGAKAHKIYARKGSALAFAGGRYSSVNHPGMQARPFLRPALDARAQDAVVAAGNYIKQRLQNKHGLDTSDIVIEAGE